MGKHGQESAGAEDEADAVTGHGWVLPQFCQEELINPGRDVSINSNCNSIRTHQRHLHDASLGHTPTRHLPRTRQVRSSLNLAWPHVSQTAVCDDVTGVFSTSGSEREFTLEERWYADEETQAGADRNAATAD